jgi:predicted dehydrogenase
MQKMTTDRLMADLTASIQPPLPIQRDVGIGCIGAGFIMADCQLVAYRQHQLRPVAITSRTRSTAEAVAARHSISAVLNTVEDVVDHPEVEVLDIAVPPDCQADVIRRALSRKSRLRGILAQKPLGRNYTEALEIVRLCEAHDVMLAVNQNMRFDQSVRACRTLLDQRVLGDPVLATIEMRAVPHWMPWQQRQGWVTLRIMSIHHLDTLRYWLGEPERVYASIRPDPRTSKQFAHEDGIALYILDFPNGLPGTLESAGDWKARKDWQWVRLAGRSIRNGPPVRCVIPRERIRESGIVPSGVRCGFRMHLLVRWLNCSAVWSRIVSLQFPAAATCRPWHLWTLAMFQRVSIERSARLKLRKLWKKREFERSRFPGQGDSQVPQRQLAL